MPNIISVRDHPEYFEASVDYFSSKRGIDRQVYHDSIGDAIRTVEPLPRWYLMLAGGAIIGDNAAMIAAQGYYELCAGHTAGWDLNAAATKPMEEGF